ncbi:MAG: Uma2 family endonuclease [Candidatus Eremiobacteraeota bacterium]|nr:Uma2 family endonuclease [Candidatus Eremiobacteraeota bacterium]
MRPIYLPEAKPALEWVNGRVLQKVSPRQKHSLAQSVFLVALVEWTRKRGNGMAGAEWHFQVQPPGEISRTLVPDVAFLSYKRMPRQRMETNQVPWIAPDAVVEVRSPGDLARDIREKIRVYLAAGTRVVFLIDPKRRIVTIHDRIGSYELHDTDTLGHEALSGFSLKVKSLFELPGRN